MTTIVYDHKNKIIACDSRESANGFLCKDTAEKFYYKGDSIWFICGAKGDAKLFVDDFEHNKKSLDNLSCCGFYVDRGVAHIASIEDGFYKSSIMDYTDGVGSGGWLALSAVDLGKTAKEAVEYAMTRDLFSGGKVHVYDIDKARFLE